ncbi:MCP four helix bundle domain-containing protein [Spirosoma sp.]|uniref:MCP four helix bundle domain-containing protein n=1 Tax=Spirosoma sp. TaxID=1899569 RepID=UPI003B3B2CF5
MKWSFVIQQKLKAALLLTGLMAVIILTTLVATHNIRGIDRSSTSMYQDRLVPAISIVYLSENLYKKRLLVENYLLSEARATPVEIREQLKAYNTTIDSLIYDFEKTYLVREESRSLHAFKACLSVYASMEQTILQLSETGNREASHALFERQSSATFQQSITLLNELIKIQSIVGQELFNNSRSEASQFSIISTVQIGISIIIGLIILGLIHNAKLIDQDRQPFHLN